MQKTKVRKSGIELLRMLMMLQVIFLHVCDYGKFTGIATSSADWYVKGVYYVSYYLSRCPVFVFVIITGYFCIKAENYYTNHTMKGRFLKTYLPMLFYSILIPFFLGVTGLWDLSWSDIIKAFLPITSDTWYFMTLYIILLLLIPFLNMCLQKCEKKQYTILIAIMAFMFCIWQPLAKTEYVKEVFRIGHVFNTEGGKSLYDFIFMYALGGYIRRFIPQRDKPRFIYALLFFVSGFMNALLYILSGKNYPASYNDNLFAVIQTVCLLLFFRDLKFQSKVINKFASFNLGIFMIHMHPILRKIIWDDVFKVTQTRSFYTTWYFPIQIFLICLAIYLACSVLDEIRQLIFKGIDSIKNKLIRPEK